MDNKIISFSIIVSFILDLSEYSFLEFVWLFLSDKRQNGWTFWAHSCSGNPHDPGKVYGLLKIQIFPGNKCEFLLVLKMHKFEQKISRNTNYTEKLTVGELSLSFSGFCLIETDPFGLMGCFCLIETDHCGLMDGFYLIETDHFGLMDGFRLIETDHSPTSRWRVFALRPHICFRHQTFHWRPPAFHWIPQIFVPVLQIFIEDPNTFIGDPKFFWRPQIFIGDPKEVP